MIDEEIAHAKQGEESYIGIKINFLTDKAIITKLVEASQAGVKIETRSTLTLGKTVTDLYSDKQFDEKNATVVLDVDRDRFIEILKDCIKAI